MGRISSGSSGHERDGFDAALAVAVDAANGVFGPAQLARRNPDALCLRAVWRRKANPIFALSRVAGMVNRAGAGRLQDLAQGRLVELDHELSEENFCDGRRCERCRRIVEWRCVRRRNDASR
jgi:hypothetical protein